jgi:transposase
LEAIAWRFRTGAPWRDIPSELGAWQSIWERHRRWSTDGRYAAMFAAVRAHSGAGDLDLAASIRRASVPISMPPVREPRTTQGAQSNYMNLAGEPADHALGRSRGGWTTKVQALVDASCAPLMMTLTAGQSGDNPQLAPLVAHYTATGARGFRLLADKAYSHDSTRRSISTATPSNAALTASSTGAASPPATTNTR